MRIEIFRDRDIDIERDGQAGNIDENNAEILKFTFPEQIVGNDINLLNKYIEFELDGKVKPFEIVNDEFAITSEITQYNTVKAQVSIMKSGLLVFKSNTFYLNFGNSLESNIVIDFTDLEIINTLKEEIQTLKTDYKNNLATQNEYLTRLVALEELSIQIQNTLNEIISGEDERVQNENARVEVEKLRVQAENLRNTAEQERNANEEARETSENKRNLAEQTRNENESKREEGYKSIQTEEEKRAQAEIERQNIFNSQMQKVDNAVSNITDLKDDYNQNASEKIEEFNTNATNKTAEFNTNTQNNITEFDTNAQSKTDDFNTNYEEKMAEISEVTASIEQERTISDEKYARALKTEVTETDFATIHAEHNKIENLEIYGAELTQETREGYNLLKLITDYLINTNNSATYEKIDDYVKVIMPETPSQHDGIYINTIKAELTNYVGQTGYYSFYAKADSNRSIMVKPVGENKYYTFNLTTNWQRFSIPISSIIEQAPVFYCGNTLSTVAYYIKDIMLELEDTLHDYEQRGASPSLKHPSEVKIVSKQTITNSNENIFDLEKYPFTSRVAYNGGTQVYWDGYCGILDYFPVKENTEYTFSNDLGKSMYYGLVFYDEKKNVLSGIYKETATFTTPKDCAYIRFAIQSSILPTWIQIEYGSTATKPAENQGSIFAITLPDGQFNGAIGDVKDCIKKIDGVWKIEKNIPKIVFDGTEGWEYTGIVFRRLLQFKSITSNYGEGMCNYFRQVKGTVGNLDEAFKLQEKYIQFRKSDITTVEDWKAKLAELYANGTPLYVCYVTENPEYIDLPQETQDTLNNLEILIGLNNISIDHGTFSFTYNKDLAYTLESQESTDRESFSGNYNDLTNKPNLTIYAKNTDLTTYAKSEDVTKEIYEAVANINQKQVVTSLEEMTDASIIYLISNNGSDNNIYDEYIVVNGIPEKIGTTEVDLNGYVKDMDLEATKTELETQINELLQNIKTLTKRIETLEANKSSNISLSGNDISYTSTEDVIYDIYFADESGVALSNYSKICEFNATEGITSTYTDLNNFNVAPENAKKIIAVNQSTSEKVDELALNSSLSFPSNLGNKLYSFGALADVHLDGDGTDNASARSDFENALNHLNTNESAGLVCIAGDIVTEAGYDELATYKEIVDANSTSQIYTCRGNHDCRYSLKDWQTYTGQGLYFETTYSNDVFLFVGMNTETYDDNIFTTEELTWLETKLEEYKNRRVFLFFHVFMPDTCGNINNLYPWSGLDATSTNVQKFIALMTKYKNVIYFSGHSHLEFGCQEYGENANIFDNGTTCHRVHIPSCARPRKNDDGTTSDETYYHEAGSQGYVVDVYEDAIILRGIDFIEGKFLPIASYIIDTTIVEIEDTETETVVYITPNSIDEMGVDASITDTSFSYDESTHKANFGGTFTEVSKEWTWDIGDWDSGYPAVGQKIRISFDKITMQNNTDINVRVFATNSDVSEKVYEVAVSESDTLSYEYEILDTTTYIYFCVRASGDSILPNTMQVEGFKVEII